MSHDLAGCSVCVESEVIEIERQAVGADEPLGEAVNLAGYIGACNAQIGDFGEGQFAQCEMALAMIHH